MELVSGPLVLWTEEIISLMSNVSDYCVFESLSLDSVDALVGIFQSIVRIFSDQSSHKTALLMRLFRAY